MPDYVWIEDPRTGQPERVSYDDLDSDTYPHIFRPIGGFCYPATTFTSLSLAPAPYYIRDWLPCQGKALLYAPAKSGKSFLTYQIARCIGQGEPLLDMPTSPARVLILQFELGEEVLQHRLRATKQSYDNVFVGTTFSMKLDTRDGQDILERALDATTPQVLILDPFYKIIRGDENEAHDVLKITDYLDGVIQRHNLSVFIVHHPGKDISKGGRGSSVLEGWVDSYIQMQRIAPANGDKALKVRITPKLLRHAALPPQPIEAQMSLMFEFELLGARVTIKDKVRNLLQADISRTWSVKGLMESGFGSRKAVNEALEKLIDEGVVMRPNRGEYCATSGEYHASDDEEGGEPLRLED